MAHTKTTRTSRKHLAAFGALAATLATTVVWMTTSASTQDPDGWLAEPQTAAAGAKAPATAAPGPRDPSRTTLAERAPELTGAYRAAIGTRLQFALSARIGCELIRRADGTSAGQNAIQLDGSLELTVLDRRDDEAVVAIRLAELQASSPGADSPEANAVLAQLGATLDQPTLALMDTTGRVEGYRFPAGASYLEKAQMRAVLAGMRFIVTNDAATQPRWSTLDRDDSGEFEASYSWRGSETEARELTRERTRYTAPSIVARGDGELRVTAQGRSTAAVSDELGWLVDASFDIRTIVSFDAMEADVHSTSAGSVELTDRDLVARGELPSVDWEGAWEPVGGDPRAALALADQRELDRWGQDLDGVALGDVIAQLAGLAAAGAGDSEEYREVWEKLARLFEVRPELASEVTAWLTGGRVDDATCSAVLTALGCAGTPLAQTTLLELQRNTALSDAARGTATIALMQVQEPTGAALATMFESARGEVVEGDLGRLSLLVLGAVAPRATGALPDGRGAIDALLALEDHCRSKGSLDTWLHALGNSSVPAVASHAERYLSSGDENVRGAAAAALRSARSATAERVLIAAATSDPAVTVRFHAVESLGEHGTAHARTTLCALVQRDTEAIVREAAMLGLANQLDAPARAALQHAAANDPDANLRRLASELLAQA